MSSKKKCEIYLSFDHKDDISIQKRPGWISEFQKYLAMTLAHLLGYEPDIYPIHKINKSNTAFPKFLIIFLSNNNINAPHLEKDIQRFLNAIEEETERPYSDQRIFKVKKYPVDYDQEPDVLQELIGYKFFGKNQKTGKFDVYKPFINNEIQRNYWLELSELAYNIYQSLSGQDVEEEMDLNSKFVYLCETGPDLLLHRLVIKRELQKLGFNVLPDRSFPSDPDALREHIANDISRSELILHLVGQYYDELIRESKYSLAEMQSMIISELSAEHPEINRIVWLYPGLQIKDARQRLYFDSLRKEVESKESVEIIQTSIEELKNIIRKKSEFIHRSEYEVNNQHHYHSGPIIYLLYDYVDAMAGKKFVNELRKKGFQVLEPDFGNNFIEIREKHNKNLQAFDKALLLCENSNENWLRMKLMDLLKSAGMGRKKAVLGKVVLLNNAKINMDNLKNFDVEITRIEPSDSLPFDIVEDLLEDVNEVRMNKLM